MMFAYSAFGCQRTLVVGVSTDLEGRDELFDGESFLMFTRAVVHFYMDLAMLHRWGRHTDG